MSGKRSQGGRHIAPAPLLWGACALAALVLVLGSSGTLSTWTAAVIGNDTNTTATAKAVVLKEAQGATTCFSSSTAANSSTCSTINKYGGTTTPLNPGDSRTVDVTFSNVGGAHATTFVLAPGACSQTPVAGSGTPAAANLCTNGDLTVALSCSPGATYTSGSAWSDLAYAAAAPATATKTHTATGSELNSGASWTCRFTVALSSTADVADQGVTVSQPLTWTLNK